MSKKYCIAQRIAEANTKPMIEIDDEHVFMVNTGKSTILMVIALFEDMDKANTTVKTIENMDKIISLVFKEKEVEYINSLDLTVEAYKELSACVAAAIGGKDLEEIDENLEKQEKTKPITEKWYDVFEDWDLIAASFATQYNIRLSQLYGKNDMPWDEFKTLLSGLNSKTPLGEMVAIRMEEDKDVLKHFTEEQHRIRNEWRNNHSSNKAMTEEQKMESDQQLQNMLANMFS